jgi:enoyl-CoA hydratase
MSGRTLLAEEALQLGIINRLCEEANLQADCLAVAESIVKHPFTATSQAKLAINVGSDMSLPDALELERNMCAVCFATSERTEAMAAFINKK